MISFFVHGIPQQQGSTRAFVIKGRARTTSDNPKLRGWRQVVADAAQPHAHMHTGPVAMICAFWFPRPKNLPKRVQFWEHDKQPDCDKLIRAIGDALEGIFYARDSQINVIIASRYYARDGDPVGVEIQIGATEEIWFPSSWWRTAKESSAALFSETGR